MHLSALEGEGKQRTARHEISRLISPLLQKQNKQATQQSKVSKMRIIVNCSKRQADTKVLCLN